MPVHPRGRCALDGDDGGIIAEMSSAVGEEVPAEVIQECFRAVLGPLLDSLRQRVEDPVLIAGFGDPVGVKDQGVTGVEGELFDGKLRGRQRGHAQGRGRVGGGESTDVALVQQ